MIVDKNAPEKIKAKAMEMITEFNSGKLKPTLLRRTKFFVFTVNPSWRLLSKDNGNNWLLLIYHEYERIK